jgi:hypothetical protein
MLACAGFDVFRKEEYFIARSYIRVPQHWVAKIFPYMELWNAQVNNLFQYDNGLAARNFVNKLLPFFATVILQDGVFLTTTYPNHPYSKLLLFLMQNEGYEEWCQAMKDSISEREILVEDNWREDRKYEAVLRTTEKAVNHIYKLEQNLNLKFSELANALQGYPAAPASPTSENRYGVQLSVDASPIPSQARAAITSEPTPRTQPLIPSIPILPPNIHKTIFENLEFWLEHRLWAYMERGSQSMQQLGWDSNTQFRYCKRRDIAIWVKLVAEKGLNMDLSWCEDSQTLLQIAAIMDEERGKQTVLNALHEFKRDSQLSWVKRRRSRRTRNDDAVDNATRSEASLSSTRNDDAVDNAARSEASLSSIMEYTTQSDNSEWSVRVVDVHIEDY